MKSASVTRAYPKRFSAHPCRKSACTSTPACGSCLLPSSRNFLCTFVKNGGRCASPQPHVPPGRAGDGGCVPGQPVDFRRQGRHARRHLRPVVWRQGGRHQRGHPSARAVAAAQHHLRRAYQAAQYCYHDGQQGSADGQPDAASAASPDCKVFAQDLPGMSAFECM